ncbi:MAG: DUF5916 domain-containing protein [Bacteroidota bacterium]
MNPAGARIASCFAALALALAAVPAAAFSGFSATDSGSVYPDSADGRRAAHPTIQAYRLNGQEIRLDGRLDDPAWLLAPAARGFTVSEPDRGAVPKEQTVFKVVYDESSVYFGIACLTSDPSSKIEATLTRRDKFINSDIVAFYIDPYHDHTTGYVFKVNPLGVQLDGYIYNNGDEDDDWDAVWEAETSRDENGWYAEIRIPFSAIRYRSAEDMTWGLDVWRYMQGIGQDTAWHTWGRDQAGLVSQFGELAGLRGIRAPRQLEALPYVVQRATDPATVSSPAGHRIESFQNLGADLKYGVTSDLTLNATVQPDFGQVEADPAVLNLSPFETSFQEKRPFFVEGSRFFQHPSFNLFYSRRIGTGDPNSRIRYAGKLTGKTVGGVSVAALAASSDITGDGQAQNIFKNGDRLARFFVGRFGKEFAQGRHQINFMQTAVLNTENPDTAFARGLGERASRDAFTSGMDFALRSPKRVWQLTGSFIGSVIDPKRVVADPTETGRPRFGTGGTAELARIGGQWRGNAGGRWETAKLDLNDMGYLQRADDISTYAWVQRRFNPVGKSARYNAANLNVNWNRSWMFAGRTGYDLATGLPAWHYEPGHPEYHSGNVNGWIQFKNYREVNFGVLLNDWGHHRYETRGGPIISEPLTYGGWLGATTDTRKNLNAGTNLNWNTDVRHNIGFDATFDVNWRQSSAVNHTVSLGYHNRLDDTQYLDQRPVATYGGQGIGGMAYIFGDIHQQTASVTLRSSLLFTRNQSLEVYAEPFLTVGKYYRARELARPDSYDLIDYTGHNVDASGNPTTPYDYRDNDFTYSSVNVNLVYRWQYRPGSTFFLVWKQSRQRFEDRAMFGANPAAFENGLGTRTLFRNEPENTLLAKVTYWLPI